MNIHFICRGNVLRSLIAETYMKSLQLKNIDVISSGTNVNWKDPLEVDYFANTLAVLDKHGIKGHAKTAPEQLVQSRIDSHHDVIVLMNERVIDEAKTIATLPDNIQNWNIIDIGEGHRIKKDRRELYEEEIYHEITQKVNELVRTILA